MTHHSQGKLISGIEKLRELEVKTNRAIAVKAELLIDFINMPVMDMHMIKNTQVIKDIRKLEKRLKCIEYGIDNLFRQLARK